MSTGNVTEVKALIENAKVAQDQYFKAIIRLVERLETIIEMLRRENDKKK